jgi:hypothetical protein
MQQRLAAPIFDFVFDGGEIGAILYLAFANVEYCEATFLEACRDGPHFVGGHEQADIIVYTDGIDALELEEVMSAGDQVFQFSFGALVTGPECLVGLGRRCP